MCVVQKKSLLIRQLLSSIVTKFDDLYNKMVAAKEAEQQQAYAHALSHAMALARWGTIAFVISNDLACKSCIVTL